MAWIRARSRSFSFRRPKPRTPSVTRRRTPISPPGRSTARSPRMRSRHRRAIAVRRPSSRSIRPRRLRKTTRCTRRRKFPPAAKIETPDTDKDAAIPVHPGAAAFVDGEEKTFLDRYSDYIWWGLMVLSAMGSAGAWFAGYLKKDERGNNSSLRERLLDLIAATRRSDSTEELDQMQAEADEILRDILNCFENGAIEEGALTA